MSSGPRCRFLDRKNAGGSALATGQTSGDEETAEHAEHAEDAENAEAGGTSRTVDEGLGTLFEAPTFGAPGEIHGAAWNRRYPRLRDALNSRVDGPSTRLDALFGMSDLVFAGMDPDAGAEGAEEDARARAEREARMLLHYAMARYACWWLDERRQLWPFYQAWRDGFARDPTGEKAFADVVGKTPAQANAESG